MSRCRNDSFATTLKELMRQENLLHYGVLAQKGLSNALTRRIFEERDLNASIFTINEVSKSVLKRGHVSVALSQNNDTAEIASVSTEHPLYVFTPKCISSYVTMLLHR